MIRQAPTLLENEILAGEISAVCAITIPHYILQLSFFPQAW